MLMEQINGAESWSYADILNNSSVSNPTVNPWNEKQDLENKNEN